MRSETVKEALRPRQKVVPLGILAGGVISALIIFVTAGRPIERGGERPEDSKRYVRQMEVYGGRANVLASELRDWFGTLWHGRRLAFSVLCVSVLLAAVTFVGLTPLPPRADARHGSRWLGRPQRDRSRS